MTMSCEAAPVPTRVRVAGILRLGRRVLMESTADRELWGIPGGGLEDGESLTDACVREYREELGLQVQCGRLAVVTDHFYIDEHGADRHVVCFYFEVHATPGQDPLTASSREPHLQFRWVELDRLRAHAVIPVHLYDLLPSTVDAEGTAFVTDDERGERVKVV